MSNPVRLGLLGNNIGRSRAKNLHELLGEMYGLDVTYKPMDLAGKADVNIAEELQRCRREGYTGVNVTHPYKKEAISSVSLMDGFPAGLTSVNTVIFDGEKMSADNTDYTGCVRAFKDSFGDDFKPGRVLMLGAGGVGVAIACAMRELGAAELVISDLNEHSVADLTAQLGDGSMPIRPAGDDIVEETRLADGLINATPIGMFQYPGCAFDKTAVNSQKWAFDAVYTPENTEFLDACRKKNIATLSGFKLFLFQGLDAFERFAGYIPDAKEVEKEFLRRFPLE